MTYYILKYTKLNVTLVFHNEGLLETDKKNNELMFTYARKASMRPDERVTY